MKNSPFGVIYCARNLINNKVYIGQTTWDIEKYIVSHMKCALETNLKKYFYNAIRKHGIQNFIWKVLAHCYSMDDLDWAEKYFILEYYESNSSEKGYNVAIGGHWGNYTDVELKLHGEMCSKINKETWQDPIVRKNRIEGLKKVFNHPDYKLKMSKMYKVLFNTPDQRLKRKIYIQKMWDSPQGQIRKQQLSNELKDPNCIRSIKNKKRMIENNPNKNGHPSKGKILLMSKWEDYSNQYKVFTLLEFHILSENLCSVDTSREFLKQLILENKLCIYFEKGQQIIYYIEGLEDHQLQNLIKEKKEILHMKRKVIQKELQSRPDVAEKRNINSLKARGLL